MFENILVSGELLPLREAASQGDLDAMLILADHVLEGKNTKACGETAFGIINKMFAHKDFTQNLPRAWEVYILCCNAEQLLYWQGKNTYLGYIKRCCDYLQWLIEVQTQAPRSMWNYRQLEACLAWIRENEPKLQEAASL